MSQNRRALDLILARTGTHADLFRERGST